METEERLAEYVCNTRYDDIPKDSLETMKNVILTVLGTAIAGATDESCEVLAKQIKQWGGREEATILMHGGKVPACNAAFVNSTMARALDFCDGMHPGVHNGSSSVPTALATTELVGGCNGKEFITALVLGTEVAARINSVSVYDGFDPTGVCSIFAVAAIAGRILRLNSKQMLNALALAFNKAGGSFQSNIDGSLAVRVIQGFVSQGGIICAQLAQRGITGPRNFLEGVYGHLHLYSKDRYEPELITRDLGKRFKMIDTLFKRYPSCGGTLGSTDAILALMKEKNLVPEDIVSIDIKVSPHIYRLVGQQFGAGENPVVNAQFNIQYCVANALFRKSSKLLHFDAAHVEDSRIIDFTKKIHVSPELSPDDPEKLGTSLKTHMEVTTKDGDVYDKTVLAPRGSPENPMTKEEHRERFQECINYCKKRLPTGNIEKIVSFVDRLEEATDVRRLIQLLTL